MTDSGVLALSALVSFGLLPQVLSRWAAQASPRVSAAAYLVGLLGWAVLPATVLACAGQAVAGLAGVGRTALRNGCWLGVAAGDWRLVGYSLGAIALAPVVWHAVRVGSAARRVELSGRSRRQAERRQLASGNAVWVLASDEAAAFAGGVLHPSAVVTTGLLEPLDTAERDAVCEHEAAHVQLGHPRLLLLGAVIFRAYGFLPPVRCCWAGLRRELEAAADDEAARIVGVGALLTALARVGLAQAGVAAAFGDREHLRYRLRRLQGVSGSSRPVTASVGAAAGALVAMLTWTTCSFLTRSPGVPGLLGCAAAAVALGVRPLWGRRPAHRPIVDS